MTPLYPNPRSNPSVDFVTLAIVTRAIGALIFKAPVPSSKPVGPFDRYHIRFSVRKRASIMPLFRVLTEGTSWNVDVGNRGIRPGDFIDVANQVALRPITIDFWRSAVRA
jgi:hypothetical protein